MPTATYANRRRAPAPAEDPRTRILNAAHAELLEHGPTELSLRVVARRAHIAPASIYEHFDGRAGLLAALAETADQDLEALLVKAGETGRTPTARLTEIALCYVQFARANRERFFVLFGQLPGPAVPTSVAASYRVLLDAVTQAASQIRTRIDVEYTAYAIWALAHGVAMLSITQLADYAADLETANRPLFESAIRLWLGA